MVRTAMQYNSLSVIRRNPNYLTSLWEEEHSQGGSDGSWVQVLSEDAGNNSVGAMGSDDLSPAGSELTLVSVLSSVDVADSLSEVPSSSFVVVNTFNLYEGLVGVLGVSGSKRLGKFSRMGIVSLKFVSSTNSPSK